MSFLHRVCAALARARVRYAVVGGYAVALHGAVRGTVDVDIVLTWRKESLVRAEQALLEIGLVSRLPVSANEVHEFRREYIENRDLVAWNFYNPTDPSEQVDVIIAYDLANGRTQKVQTEQGPISLLGRRDLIEMKRESGRPQDLEDVRALESLG